MIEIYIAFCLIPCFSFLWFISPALFYSFSKATIMISQYFSQFSFSVIENQDDGQCVIHYKGSELILEKPYPTGTYIIRLCKLNKEPHVVVGSSVIKIITLSRDKEYTLRFPLGDILVPSHDIRESSRDIRESSHDIRESSRDIPDSSH